LSPASADGLRAGSIVRISRRILAKVFLKSVLLLGV
jgi:hypothetical protein